MKTLAIIIAASLAFSTSSFAAKKGKGEKRGKKGEQGIGKVLKGFDTNGNKAIDGEEVQKLKDAFSSNKALKPLDKNKNSALEDDEISKLNERLAKAGKEGKKAAGKGAKKKGKKKNK
jgi:hypothetical protein